MLDRQMETEFGWPLYLSSSPNKRTLYNFLMQGGGAEMLRVGRWRLCEAGIVPNMLVHDAVLLEVQSDEQIEYAKEIMRQTGRDVCRGLDIGVDIGQPLKNSARYRDKRGKEMWITMMRTLQEVGAIPPGELPLVASIGSRRSGVAVRDVGVDKGATD